MAALKQEVNLVEGCKRQPLFLFYDCEAANSNIYTGDIIEIAAKSYPEVRKAEFESLINTSQELAKFTIYEVFCAETLLKTCAIPYSAVEKCGINATDLEGKQSFPDVLNKFLNWTKKLVRKVNQKTGNKHFPVDGQVVTIPKRDIKTLL